MNITQTTLAMLITSSSLYARSRGGDSDIEAIILSIIIGVITTIVFIIRTKAYGKKQDPIIEAEVNDSDVSLFGSASDLKQRVTRFFS